MEFNWLDGYREYAAPLNAPELFVKWAGIFTLGAACQRRFWIRSLGQMVYPNLYIFLTGPSAAGKGKALGPIIGILRALDKHFLAPDSVTAAALADEFADAYTTHADAKGNVIECNPVTIVSEELGVMLPEYDRTMTQNLTKLYDNLGYTERRRSKGKIETPGAHLSLIAGTTPAYLQNMLPEGAWEHGFMSRVIMVYSGPLARQPLTEEMHKHLLRNLNKLLEKQGRITWTPEARDALNDWYYVRGGKPAPTHPKLATYVERRHYNAMKIAMIYALAEGRMQIEVGDFNAALELLLETEAVMPDAFKAMRSGGDQAAMKEAWHFLFQLYVKKPQPIPKWKLAQFLGEKVPAHNVDRIIQVMVMGRLIKEHSINKVGPAYEPLKPEEMH
jgi:hypothetical protein